MSSKKQLEAELQEAEAQVETANRGKEEAVKQLRRLQVKQKFPLAQISIYFDVILSVYCVFNIYIDLLQGQIKELLRELDETKLTRDEVITQSKDSEKKIQTLEAEVLQLTEVSVLHRKNTFTMGINVVSDTLNVPLCVGAVCVRETEETGSAGKR